MQTVCSRRIEINLGDPKFIIWNAHAVIGLIGKHV